MYFSSFDICGKDTIKFRAEQIARKNEKNVYLCENMAKTIYTMGEVAEILGENTSAVRYWSNYFERFVHPVRNGKGNRLFHPEDVEALKQIRFLVKEQGLTLDGAAARLNEDRRSVESRVKALDSLKRIREELLKARAAL